MIVGGDPAGLARARKLSQLIDEHNAKYPGAPLSKENIYVLEKAREIGQHCLSSALLDPGTMRELLPDFEKEAPLEAPVERMQFTSSPARENSNSPSRRHPAGHRRRRPARPLRLTGRPSPPEEIVRCSGRRRR